jgi:hypothetical protein
MSKSDERRQKNVRLAGMQPLKTDCYIIKLRPEYLVNIFCKVINNTSDKSDHLEDSQARAGHEASGISDEDLKRLLLVEFKSQSYASFYNTSMEKDKSILTLSVAGIGFLVTLLNLSKTIDYVDLSLFIIAAISFLVSIYCVVTLFGKNADYIVDLTQDRDITLKEYKLRQFDKWAIRSFYLAIIVSIVLGVSTSTSLVKQEERIMSDKETIDKVIDSGVKPSNEIFQGAVNVEKSVSGAGGLTPQANTQANTSSLNNSSASGMKPDISPQKKD